MKKKLILAVCFLILSFIFVSNAKAQEIFDVSWNLIEDGISHKCYEIKIQNLDSVKHFFNLTSFFSGTSFPLEEMKNIMFYEWTGVSKEFPVYDNVWSDCVYVFTPENMTQLPLNCELCDATHYKCLEYKQVGTEAKTVADWQEAKMKVFKVLTTGKGDLKGNSGNINIPKKGAYEYDSFNNIIVEDGTKKFKLCFDAPITYIEGLGYGSYGKVGIRDENGNYEEDPWWNLTFRYRKNITVTENSGNEIRDYPVFPIYFKHDGNAKSDCSDIRILEGDTTEIDFATRNCNSTHVELSFRVNLTAYQNKWFMVYYGNPSASSVAKDWNDISYNVWDTFENLNKWEVKRGSIALDSGWVKMSAPNNWATAQYFQNITMRNFLLNYLYKYGSKPSGWKQGQTPVIWAYDGHYILSLAVEADYIKTDENPSVPYIFGDVGTVYNVTFYFKNYNSTHANATLFMNESYVLSDFYDYNKAGYEIPQTWNSAFYIQVADDNNGQFLDNLFLRHYVDPEPTYSIGEEELPPIICGDNICSEGENPSNCFKDCGGATRTFLLSVSLPVLALAGVLGLISAFFSAERKEDWVRDVIGIAIFMMILAIAISYLINM